MYIHNFRIDACCMGVIPSARARGKLESVDEASIKDIPGVIKVVRDGVSSAFSRTTNGPPSAPHVD